MTHIEPLSDAEELILNEILRGATDDWSDMSAVAGVLVHYARLPEDPPRIRDTAFKLISVAAQRGLIQPGMVRKDEGFIPYGTFQEARTVLERQWPMDRLPNLGELSLWLKLTEVGRAWLRERGLTW